jgi:hypothetical protein
MLGYQLTGVDVSRQWSRCVDVVLPFLPFYSKSNFYKLFKFNELEKFHNKSSKIVNSCNKLFFSRLLSLTNLKSSTTNLIFRNW